MNDLYNNFLNFYSNTIIDILNNWDYVPIQARQDIKSNIERGLKLMCDNWSRCKFDLIDYEQKISVRDPHCFDNFFSITRKSEPESSVLEYYVFNNGFLFRITVDYDYEYEGDYISIGRMYPKQKRGYSANNQKRIVK